MENSGAHLCQDFNKRLNTIKLMADELPSAVIIHQVEDLSIVYMNKPGLDTLGITIEELRKLNSEQYFARYFNTEDSNDYVPKIIYLIKSTTNDQVCYFQQLRDQQSKEWQLYVSNTKVFCRDKDGKATHILTIASKIDPVHHITRKVNRLMDELSFVRSNNLLFLKLTKREKEVLKCIASGMNSGEIADTLFISPATADTHRRNLRNKLCLKNNYDAVKFAQAYNLI